MTVNTNSQNLLSPLQISSLSLANRVVMSPLTRSRAGEELIPHQLIAEYYQQRASAGLIITEATVISKQGIGWRNSPGIYSDQQAQAWQKIVDAVHSKNGKIFRQLWHCRRSSYSDFRNGQFPVAPPAIKLNGDYIHTPLGKRAYETPRAL